jgi:hypothetical protein
MGIPDHTDHRPPHCIVSSPAPPIQSGSCIAAGQGSTRYALFFHCAALQQPQVSRQRQTGAPFCA